MNKKPLLNEKEAARVNLQQPQLYIMIDRVDNNKAPASSSSKFEQLFWTDSTNQESGYWKWTTMKKIVLSTILGLLAGTVHADTSNYYTPQGYWVGPSFGPGQCGYIYLHKLTQSWRVEAARGLDGIAGVAWKVGPPAAGQNENWGAPTSMQHVGLIAHLLHLFGGKN
jgi:hypothetical protein